MKLRMHENSLFAILLRSSWWISFAIAAGIVAFVRLVLPGVPVVYAVFAALPFIVIGAIAGWRQLRQPGARRVVDTLAAVRAMSWGDFSSALEDAYRREGYTVGRLTGSAADFELTRGGRTCLVACKRWKVARTGVEPLRDLDAEKRSREAQECVYVAAGEITDGALKFAREKAIRIVHGPELVKLLPRARHDREGVRP
jgi:restriction system protein